MKYGKNRASTIFRLIGSIPKILIGIKREKVWLRGFAAREGLHLVISDNRYGLVAPGICCIFMTHQLLIPTPFGGWADRLLQRINYRYIRHFSRCWVCDIKGPGSLAGGLSNPGWMPPVDTRYIGVLSRMGAGTADGGGAMEGRGADGEEPYVLAVLSGPEPQRSLLERSILRQAGALSDRLVLVRGLPGGGSPLTNIPATVRVYDHLPAAELERMIAAARLVIARSGYSTVMDLARMGKRAVLIPTPGQTEQEYLGRYLASKGWVVCMRQNEFSLRGAISADQEFAPWPGFDDGERLRAEISSVLAQVRAPVH